MPTSTAPVYVVDDDPSVRDAVGRLVRSAGWKVETFSSAQDFLSSRWAAVPSCLVLDVRLPGLSGLDLQQHLAKSGARTSVIFLTGYGDIPTSVRAIKAGALEFLTKPVADENLIAAIEQGLTHSHRQPSSSDSRFNDKRDAHSHSDADGLVGTSRAFRAVLEQVARVAPTPSTALILGETGTGKELVARAIHRRSTRSARPFVGVNCGAIPQSLVASELFGHEKGAFTGALQRRVGRFELADGGTIFLDEVGELPAETQVALLRVLQEREIERIGGHQPIAVDVRVIAATNRDLRSAIAEGTFRSDLFYRLNVFPIEMPPLRARREDISLLVEHFAERHACKYGAPACRISPTTMAQLQSYSWPGNVRELQNVVERALIVSDPGDLCVEPSWIPSAVVDTAADGAPADQLTLHQRRLIEGALAETGGQVAGASGAAAKLGMKSSTLESKIRSLRIDKHRFRTIY
jgi:DNA-binding NtrC family response regulator